MNEERDDDDTPNVRDDNHPHPIAVVAKLARNVDAEFYAAFKAANSGNPKVSTKAMLEMMVLTIHSDEMPGRNYTRIPVHLPDDEKGMRALSVSKVAQDADLKAELYAWARGNRDHQDKAAKALENAVGIIRAVAEVLTEPDDQTMDWVQYACGHVFRTWGVELGEAPQDPLEVPAWAWKVVGKYNLTPGWLTGEEEGKPRMFDPAAHRARNPARPFRAHGDE